MKGLLTKDLLTIQKKYGIKRLVMDIAIIIALMIVLEGTGAIYISFLLIPLEVTSMVISLTTCDEQWKWGKYAISLPVSKTQIVKSRYVFAGSMALIGLGVALIVNVISYFCFPAYRFGFYLFLLAQPRNFVIHLDYSPRKSPIISLTGRFTAQIRHVIFAWIPFDHMFAHRQRKTCPPGDFPGGQVLFRVTQPLGSIAFWPGIWSSCVPVACFLRSAAAPLLRYPYRFSPQLSAASHL